MDWKELKIHILHKNMENLSAALISAGVTGLVINDPEDIKAFAEEKSSSWDYIDDELLKTASTGDAYITVYISDDSDGAILMESIDFALNRLKGMGIDYAVELGSIREEDWANEWKKYFKPQPVGKKLIIKPTWENVGDTDRKIVELDPESSFGTGRHYTTQLCLELLEDIIKPGDSIIDLGCGSGIIFISALALGADYAVGVDISKDAEKISRKNALQNGFSEDKFRVFCGDIVADPEIYKKVRGHYSIVAANIVADVLLSMKDIFWDLSDSDGVVILSGIIAERRDEVFSAMTERGFIAVREEQRDIWCAGVFKMQA